MANGGFQLDMVTTRSRTPYLPGYGYLLRNSYIAAIVKLMRQFLRLPFVLLASVVLASAEPWTVLRVYRNSFLVRSKATPPSATHPRGTHHIKYFRVTPATKFFVNGNQGSFADLKNGVHVNVKSHGGDADRVDIVP